MYMVVLFEKNAESSVDDRLVIIFIVVVQELYRLVCCMLYLGGVGGGREVFIPFPAFGIVLVYPGTLLVIPINTY